MTEISEPIDLAKPIKRESGAVEKVQVRKPYGGELRGLEIGSIIRGDYDQVKVLLSRSTVPLLQIHEVEKLDPFDLGALSGTLTGFFIQRPSKDSSEDQ